jgi:hypothetical protein
LSQLENIYHEFVIPVEAGIQGAAEAGIQGAAEAGIQGAAQARIQGSFC